MRVNNFDREMEKIISGLKAEGKRPKLLLHSCCAPCSTACIERLASAFDLTVYYYNPNLDTEEEFNLRAKEQLRYCEEIGVDCIVEKYDKSEFLQIATEFENIPEGGVRCFKCFNLRLSKTAQKAKEHGFEYFTTTLTVSPLKNAAKLNEIGKAVSEKVGVKFLPTDFKKKNGYLRSIELSKQNNLYRQNYCGCEFSKNAIPNA